MPIYEFHCSVCVTTFEEIVPSGTEASECPQCRAPNASRQLSAFAAPSRGPSADAPDRTRAKPPSTGGCGGGCGCGH